MAEKRDEGPGFLADIPPTSPQDDVLAFSPYVDSLALLIDRRATATPLVVAISAPWGAGKTTLARLIQHDLTKIGEWNEPHVTCWFNAWENDDAPHLGAAFAAEVARQADQNRPWWARVLAPLPSIMLRPDQRWRRKLAQVAIAFGLAFVIVVAPVTGRVARALLTPDNESWTVAEQAATSFGSIVVLFILMSYILPKLFSGVKAVAKFVDDPKSEAASGSISDVRRQLQRLIRQATREKRRFVIFVDDLERCRPPRAVEVCEVASQLLCHEGVVTVLIADMQTIANSAAIKYRALEELTSGTPEFTALGLAAYGRAYLQKLIQLQFELPPPTHAQLRAMVQRSSSAQSEDRFSGLPDLPKNPRRSTSILAVSLGFTVAVAVSGLVLYSNGPNLVAGVGIIAGAAAPLAVFSTLAVELWERRNRLLASRAREAVTTAISSQAAQGQDAESLVSQGQSARDELSDRRTKLDVRRLAYGSQLEHLSAAADEVALRYLPARPRAAKRLINQMRLLLVIGQYRGLFSAQEKDATVAWLIAKWCILTERWPEVARAIEANSAPLAQLEEAAKLDIQSFQQLVGSHWPRVDNVNDLKRLLAEAPPFGVDWKTISMLSVAPSADDPAPAAPLAPVLQ